jgi:hypothetical protein
MISNQNLCGVEYTTNVSPFLLWRIIERGSVRDYVLRFACAPEELCLLCLRSAVALGGGRSAAAAATIAIIVSPDICTIDCKFFEPSLRAPAASLSAVFAFYQNQAAEGKGSAMRRVMVQGLARFSSSSSSSSSRYYTHASACLAAAETSTDKVCYIHPDLLRFFSSCYGFGRFGI